MGGIPDYEEPDVERIAAEIIKPLLKNPDYQVGTRLIDSADEFLRGFVENQGRVPEEEDLDYVLLRRRGGYIDQDTFTDYSGLDVTVFTRQRSRGQKLMSQITREILRSENKGYLGFDIDYVEILNGPNPDELNVMEDHVIEKTFEFQIRVKWL